MIMQSVYFDDREIYSESAFNYITNKMIEMAEQEDETVKDLSSYRWVIGRKVANHIFPERPTRIFGYDVIYEDPGIFYQNGINFEPGVVNTKNCSNCRFGNGGICPKINVCVTSSLDQSPSHWNEMFKKEDKKMDIKSYECGAFVGGVVTKPQDLIKNVIFSGPCTIVQWTDGDKTIVRCENEDFDKEKGLAMAIVKKLFGTNESKSNYNDIFKKWIPEEEEVPEFLNKNMNISEDKKTLTKKYYTVKELSEIFNISRDKVRNNIKNGLYPGAIKQSGAWLIPYNDFKSVLSKKNCSTCEYVTSPVSPYDDQLHPCNLCGLEKKND